MGAEAFSPKAKAVAERVEGIVAAEHPYILKMDFIHVDKKTESAGNN
jgi:hypothetical protein